MTAEQEHRLAGIITEVGATFRGEPTNDEMAIMGQMVMRRIRGSDIETAMQEDARKETERLIGSVLTGHLKRSLPRMIPILPIGEDPSGSCWVDYAKADGVVIGLHGWNQPVGSDGYWASRCEACGGDFSTPAFPLRGEDEDEDEDEDDRPDLECYIPAVKHEGGFFIIRCPDCAKA